MSEGCRTKDIPTEPGMSYHTLYYDLHRVASLDYPDVDLPWTLGAQLRGLYDLVRRMKPKIAVDTGVHRGFTSAAILAAMSEYDGQLYSIDLPTLNPEGRVNADGRVDRAHVDAIGETGILIPMTLRQNWHLTLGDATEVLPTLLTQLGSVDFFFHDSDHTYEQMMFEYSTVWPYLSPGGVLASDDITWNEAFVDFALEVKATPHYWPFKYYMAHILSKNRWPYRGWIQTI
jgi:predicted O-methyltransferase YrrM